MKPKYLLRISIVTALVAASVPAFAQSKSKTAPAPKAPAAGDSPYSDAERLNVDGIKEKYWARGNETEMGVVQNRMYTKERKFELGVFAGVASSDPFIDVKTMAFSLGFHLSEYISLHAHAWKLFSKNSQAWNMLAQRQGVYNTNQLTDYYGIETRANLIYGKLSLVGKAILHYDLYTGVGLGLTGSESGSNFTPSIGVGQQFHITQLASVGFDYRIMRFAETEIEKVIDASKGQSKGDRVKYNHVIMLGVSFLWGFGQ